MVWVPEEPAESSVVVLFASGAAKRKQRTGTSQELAEYRRIKPQLLQMLREWEALKSGRGCPVARSILAPTP